MTVYRLPGLIDPHVHLREPGGTYKENFTTGTAAALAGGFTCILDMPNSSPPTTDKASLQEKQKLAGQKALCDVGFYLGAGQHNAETGRTLAQHVTGLKMYLNQTYGPLQVGDLATLMAHFRYWPRQKPIAVHAEGSMIAVAIALGQLYDRQVHICHVSRREEIILIAAAKEKGARITCEVTPHHLFLTEADAQRLGPLGHMSPPLGTSQDREALWAHLEMIDCIASDHAPHTIAEKEEPNPPPGVPGLETTLPLLLTAVAEGRLSLDRLVELTSINQRRIFGLPPAEEACVEVDLGARYVLAGSELKTKCGWTPFEGMAVQGQVRRVTLRGVTAYEDGEVLVAPGFGRVLFGEERW